MRILKFKNKISSILARLTLKNEHTIRFLDADIYVWRGVRSSLEIGRISAKLCIERMIALLYAAEVTTSTRKYSEFGDKGEHSIE